MLCPGSNSQTYPAVITRTILCTNLLQKLWLKFYHKNWLDTLRKNVEALLQPQVNLKVKAVIKYLLLPGMGGRPDPTLQMNLKVSKVKWETTFDNSYFCIDWKKLHLLNVCVKNEKLRIESFLTSFSVLVAWQCWTNFIILIRIFNFWDPGCG